MSNADLVSVVIPAHNAAATIGETLLSVRSQTHRMLEILVIDDGSTDGTADVVRTHTALDSRIRLVRQKNGGVAAARNRGIEEAAAGLVAFVDADDLWAPEKIEKQIAALRKEGPSVGLVYTGFALIDAASRITGGQCPTEAGDVLERLCLFYFLGNCSSILVTKAAAVEVGGFDPSLRARRAQGCEDYQFCLRVAERHRFAVVPEHLTGYRQTSANMSGDLLQMRRSWALVADEMRRKHPRLEKKVALGTTQFTIWALWRAIELRRLRLIPWFGALLVWRDSGRVARILVERPLRDLVRRVRNALQTSKRGSQPGPAELPRFIVGDPDLGA
jgi:glycosyltransferase involved in cell wall biosynthesis